MFHSTSRSTRKASASSRSSSSTKCRTDDKKVPQYLMVLTEPKDGLPFDFNQVRVFTWNVKRHRYETAYRERFEGMLPVTMGKEDFGKEGVLPTFVVRVIDEDGKLSERKYKLNTPIVREFWRREKRRPNSAKSRAKRQRKSATANDNHAAVPCTSSRPEDRLCRDGACPSLAIDELSSGEDGTISRRLVSRR